MGQVIVFRVHNDSLDRLPVEAATFDEATLQTGHGVYSVFRLYEGQRVLRLSHHLSRMRRSAELLGRPFPHTDAWLRGAVRRAVDASGIALPRVRLTVPFAAPDTAIIALEPFTPTPPEVYEQGVRVGLATLHREQPRAKDSRFIEKRLSLRAAQDGTYETLLCDERGLILEGSSSNFYAVLNGRLHTAGEGVLEGVARSLLLQVAPDVLPVLLEAVRVDDLPHVREALLTSSSRGVIPVVQVGDVTIGTGVPGPVAEQLRARYDAQVAAELEPL